MYNTNWHTHTHKSNIINRDSTNRESDLINKALELNLRGLGLTDHANLCSHVDAVLHLKKLQEKAIGKEKEKLEKFKLGLGTEIYLVDRDIVNKARENNESTRFYHLVVIAKNYNGYRALAELSSKSWEESFYHRGMQRVPTYKDYFYNWCLKNKENIVISSACLGSEFSSLVLNYISESSQENKNKIDVFLYNFVKIFGEDFYIELQPSNSDDQISYNKMALKIARVYNIPAIITTDAHYLSKELREVHTHYLRSQDSERETDQFYASTYLMDLEELREYFNYFSDEDFNWCIENSLDITDKIENYDLKRDTEVPYSKIAFENYCETVLGLMDLTNYPYISKFGLSEYDYDRVLLQLIEKGLMKRNINIDNEVLNRINKELETLWLISEKMHQRLSSYYILTKEIVEITNKISLVGISRGSAGAFYICYILGITGIDPLKYNLPYWRHISPERPTLPDVDLDFEASQRANILELLKEHYGHDKVLNITTFKTEGAASAIQTMCRGMGISISEAQYLSSLVIEGKTIKESFETMSDDSDSKLLIKELMKHENLLENILEIEGLVCGRSSHASGVYIFNDSYWKTNAMMRTPKGLPITQYDMDNSDYQGGLKVDMLTIEALDRIRKNLDLLIKDGVIEWQGSLKATYDKYLNPDDLDLDNQEMYDMLIDGEIIDAFQYDSNQGRNAIVKIEPRTFQELSDGNALMRLSCDGEQPIDRYVKHKKDINVWFNEMQLVGLNSEEIAVMKKHLLKSYGVAATQEAIMRLSMDEKIAGFDLVLANKLRKGIAKAKAKYLIEEVKNEFIRNGIKLGNREVFLNYVWKTCVEPSYNYSFSEPHLAGYTLILMQEMNLAYKYGLLHWKTACLCVQAGDISEEISKGTDYGAIAKAIGNMERGFVLPPDINNSDVSFRPDIKINKVYYGLGAMNGVSADLAREIIKLRPFNNFQDFLNKCVITKIVQPSKVYNLIKGGCFDNFNPKRDEVMKEFILFLVPLKEKLTVANIPKMQQFGVIPKELSENMKLLEFRKLVFIKENIYEMLNKTQGNFIIPKNLLYYFESVLIDKFITSITYSENGSLCLNSKEFEKTYKQIQTPIIDWLSNDKTIILFNNCCRQELWNKYCLGTRAKWEMDSLSYYTGKHELDEVGLGKYYTVDNFNDLPIEPRKYSHNTNHRTYKRFNLNIIAGVVVDKNRTKYTITLNTQFGVVEVKLGKDLYVYYDKRTDNENSWFTRGTKLLLQGYRRGEVFYLKSYENSTMTCVLYKIDVKNEKLLFYNVRKVDI